MTYIYIQEYVYKQCNITDNVMPRSMCSDGAFGQCVKTIRKDLLQNVMTSLPARRQDCTDGDAGNVSIIIFKTLTAAKNSILLGYGSAPIVVRHFETIWFPLRCQEMSGSSHLQTQRHVSERQIFSSTALKISELTKGLF